MAQPRESKPGSGSPERRISYLVVDNVPIVNDFIEGIRDLNPRKQRDKVSGYIKSRLKNALAPHPPSEDRYKIRKILKQEPGSKLSEVLDIGYGSCADFHVLGIYMFEKLGIEAEFKRGTIPGAATHTFLDIKIDDAWEIFDPFAEVFWVDLGRPDLTRLAPDYYQSSRTVLDKTKD